MHFTSEHNPRVECAWHAQHFGTSKTIKEGRLPASHGLCERCAAILRRLAAKRKRKESK